MHKTTIFIIQLYVVFESIKAVNVISALTWWRHGGLLISIGWSVLFFTESFVESHSSLAPLIDQPKGHYDNMLEKWCLESMEIVATARLRLDKKSATICVACSAVDCWVAK